MKVVLKADVKGTGKKDQMVEVSDGFARNFLFPRKLAVEANASAVNDVKNKEAAKQHHLEMEKEAAVQLAKQIDKKEITIKAKAGAGGRLFGAVTAKDISEEINKKFGVNTDKRKIVLDSDIKAYGRYDITVKVYPEVHAVITVIVEE